MKQGTIAAAAIGLLMFLFGLARFNSVESQLVRGLGGSDNLSVFLLVVGSLLAVGGPFLAYTQPSSPHPSIKPESLAGTHPPAATTVCSNCSKSFPSHFYLESTGDGQYLCEQCRQEVALTTQGKSVDETSTGTVQAEVVKAPAAATQSIEERLDRLKALFEKDAISEQEYRERRGKLLDDI